ncbi:MAG TPA: HAD family phosphatase [Methylophilaceae bacterium]|nr:HAD family phosphatase [Methylophilaceae bacterium]
MIKGIVFDMDGVLIEAKDWHYDALNKALKLFGFEISRFDHLTTYDGLPTRRKLEMLSIERGLPVELHAFIDEIKQAYTMEIVHTQCKPRFVHEYALSKLKAMDYKLGLASNSIKTTIEVMMQKAKLAQYLDVQLSAEDVTKGKPDSEIYIKAMEHLGIKPSECLIVEDNENGILAARASGAHVLVVKEVDDVNIENILNMIQKIDAEASK